MTTENTTMQIPENVYKQNDAFADILSFLSFHDVKMTMTNCGISFQIPQYRQSSITV